MQYKVLFSHYTKESHNFGEIYLVFRYDPYRIGAVVLCRPEKQPIMSVIMQFKSCLSFAKGRIVHTL